MNIKKIFWQFNKILKHLFKSKKINELQNLKPQYFQFITSL
jgi:hypothetical protein